MNNNEQINNLIKIHNGDIVQEAIRQKKQTLYHVKESMLIDYELLIRHDEFWFEKAEAHNDYITKHEDRFEDWFEAITVIAYNHDINIDDIIYDSTISKEKQMFLIEYRLKNILKECILKL